MPDLRLLSATQHASLAPATQPWARRRPEADALGRLAIRSLYREVALAPKPGLVSPMDNGSHADMDFATFLRSLQALRSYFPRIAARGAEAPAFGVLQALGVAAEIDMLAATGGVNTHRGAIFNLGLLCAAAGLVAASGRQLGASSVCRAVAIYWGDAILAGLSREGDSHGLCVARRYGSGGARREAANGFPAARRIGLPAYRGALAATGDSDRAAVQALFALMAEVEDTNLLWRGGPAGLEAARQAARGFLAAGGVAAADWRQRAENIHRDFVGARLSPGGSADLLGVTLFLDGLERL